MFSRFQKMAIVSIISEQLSYVESKLSFFRNDELFFKNGWTLNTIIMVNNVNCNDNMHRVSNMTVSIVCKKAYSVKTDRHYIVSQTLSFDL